MKTNERNGLRTDLEALGEGNRLARPQEWEERAKNISWVFSTQFWGLKTAFPGINSSDKRHSDKRVIKTIDSLRFSLGWEPNRRWVQNRR